MLKKIAFVMVSATAGLVTTQAMAHKSHGHHGECLRDGKKLKVKGSDEEAMQAACSKAGGEWQAAKGAGHDHHQGHGDHAENEPHDHAADAAK